MIINAVACICIFIAERCISVFVAVYFFNVSCGCDVQCCVSGNERSVGNIYFVVFNWRIQVVSEVNYICTAAGNVDNNIAVNSNAFVSVSFVSAVNLSYDAIININTRTCGSVADRSVV